MLPLLATIFGSCSDEGFPTDGFGPAGEVTFDIGIEGMGGTRSAVDESKTYFDVGELIHVRAEYECRLEDETFTRLQYGVLKYDGRGSWSPYGASYALKWPDDAVGGSFEAYYINGSNGVLSGNNMQPKLLSDFRFDAIPLHGEMHNVRYGQAVKLQMRRVFSLLTLTDMKEGISDELWFTVPDNSDVSGKPLNNAFRLLFNPETYEMTQEFSRIASADYKDDNDMPLVFIKSKLTETETEEQGVQTEVNYLLQPGTYHKFDVLYPRGRTTYATYLTYGRDLSLVEGAEEFRPNGRYTFSILKSLGVIVEETPEDGWDDTEPTVIIDVEAFLRAANSGSDYFVKDPDTDEDVQILESTLDGTRLLRNVDFRNFYYDIFENGLFKPVLGNTFDGGYHYIYNMGCPLFYENNGVIINLGIRNAKTGPIISSENKPVFGTTLDTSYNGLITSRNYGTVSNVRVDNAEMTVQIQTSDPDEPTQEAHNASLLFGVNRGNVYDLALAGTLTLTVENAPGETVMPRVSMGGVAGQNLGTVYGLTYIDDDTFEMPVLTIYNNCRGDNGVYKVGGIVGNNTGNLMDIFIPQVIADASASSGLESYLGGMVGDNPSSNTGAPRIADCIVRGEVIAGKVTPVLNLTSLSYAGGVAGSMSIQADVLNSSVTVGVSGSPFTSTDVEYAEGGAFGILETSVGIYEGSIQTLACYGSKLTGSGYMGNFAGIVPQGFGQEHYLDKGINVRRITDKFVGLER